MLKLFLYIGGFFVFQRMNFLQFNEESLIGIASVLFFVMLYLLAKELLVNIFFFRATHLYIVIRYLFTVTRRLLRNYRRILYVMTVLKRSKNVFLLTNLKRKWLTVSKDIVILLADNVFYKIILYNKCLLLERLN